jgi:hypothetical protein
MDILAESELVSKDLVQKEENQRIEIVEEYLNRVLLPQDTQECHG